MFDPDSPFFVMIVFFGAIVLVTKVISDNRIRRKLIEAGATQEMARALFQRERDIHPSGSLKWGILLAAVGIGLMVIQALPYGPEDPITYGLLFLAGGIGLLVYYAIASRRLGDTRRGAPGPDHTAG